MIIYGLNQYIRSGRKNVANKQPINTQHSKNSKQIVTAGITLL